MPQVSSIRLCTCLVAGLFALTANTSSRAQDRHIPTRELAEKLLGLRVTIDGRQFKVEHDAPVLVEVDFSKPRLVSYRTTIHVTIRNGENKEITKLEEVPRKLESLIRKGNTIRGFTFKLAPSLMPTTYLTVAGSYVPLLDFIPDRYIDKKQRESSPDFRKEVSELFTRYHDISPERIERLAEESGLFQGASYIDLKRLLQAYGVTFPAGAVICYGERTSGQHIRTTLDNHSKIENIFGKTPPRTINQ